MSSVSEFIKKYLDFEKELKTLPFADPSTCEGRETMTFQISELVEKHRVLVDDIVRAHKDDTDEDELKELYQIATRVAETFVSRMGYTMSKVY